MDGTPLLLPPPMNHNPQDGRRRERDGRGSTPFSCQTYVKIGEMEHEDLGAADMSSMVSKRLLSVGGNNTPFFASSFFE